MFCKYCGESISEDSVFCSKCGKLLMDAAVFDSSIVAKKVPIQHETCYVCKAELLNGEKFNLCDKCRIENEGPNVKDTKYKHPKKLNKKTAFLLWSFAIAFVLYLWFSYQNVQPY